LAGYEQAGKDYRCCVVLKNLAEAERALGFKSKATRLFAEANERGMKLNDENERFGVLWNLASAYARLKEIKLQRDYLMRILTDLPNLETEKVLRINRLLSEIGP
jgi:tetratricopeptide (TPR) repeat protein